MMYSDFAHIYSSKSEHALYSVQEYHMYSHSSVRRYALAAHQLKSERLLFILVVVARLRVAICLIPFRQQLRRNVVVPEDERLLCDARHLAATVRFRVRVVEGCSAAVTFGGHTSANHYCTLRRG
jgi:hypothetical protein